VPNTTTATTDSLTQNIMDYRRVGLWDRSQLKVTSHR